MTQKTVILALPYLYGLDKSIEKNLIHCGYNVINLCYDECYSYYPTFSSRLIGLYHKVFSQDEDYKKQLKFSRFKDEIDRKLAQFGQNKADVALCIRANVYPKEIIAKIRASAKKCVNYQWDGIDAHPDILEYVDYFDRFFVFDERDAKKYAQYAFEPITNFYFDYPIPSPNIEDKKEKGIYFLGGHQKSRVADIQCFLDEADKLNLNLDFYIQAKGDRAKIAFNNHPKIHYLNSQTELSFEQNLIKVQSNDVVVDFLNQVHQGLSFRTFDALCFDKKLITTNASIKNYDFYHPNNIFIWDRSNLDELQAFLSKPYYQLDESIKLKYAFSHWIKSILS